MNLERGLWRKFSICWEECFWGRRNAYLRVSRADPWDAEQNICRMDKQQIELLGTHAGCKVNLNSVVPADYSLSEIFLDGDTRKELEVEPGDVVRARRNVPDLVKERILAGGIFLLLSSFGIGRLLPPEVLGMQDYPDMYFLLVVSLSTLFTAPAVWMDIRRRVN